MTYNSSHDPVTLKEYDYNFSYFPKKPSYITNYYYNSYIDKTEVKQIVSANDNTKVFPNPATNSITITQLNVPENTPIFMLIINIKGQMVNRTRVNWHNETEISMSDLTPGIYCLVIENEAGNILHRQAVVKQ